MRFLLIAGLLVSTAEAAPPSGYQCAPGTPTKGVGCACPAGFAASRDGDDVAICKAVPKPPPPRPEPVAPPPPPPPPPPSLATAKLKITLAGFKAPAASTVKAKPEVELDSVLSIEELTGTIRSEQERIIEDLIANTPDSEPEEKADYLFRLGLLQAKQHRHFRTSDPAKAKAYLLKAVATYKKLAGNSVFQNYPKMDVALFYYGYTLRSGNYLKEARAVFDQLLKNYPNSKYVPEAHLVFADYYYEADQLADAEARYKQVLKFPKSNAYWYAMYKMAWVHFGLQRHQESLESFFHAAQGTKNDRRNEALSRASKHGFVRAYAEIGKADKAYPALQRVDVRAAAELTSMLAGVYVEQAKYENAAYVYGDLAKQLPDHASACAWHLGFARATLATARGVVDVAVCPSDVAALADWLRRNGASVP